MSTAMHRYSIVLLCAMAVLAHARASAQSFERFFTDRTMRVDYYHTGTKGAETISLDRVYEEGPWPGSRVNLLDTLNLGEYQARVYDVATASTISSRGYSTIFNEWQTTDEALGGVYRTFHETIRFPYPKRPVQVTISRRDKKMIFHEIFSTVIDPNSPTEVNRERRPAPFTATPLVSNGPSHQKVDIVIVGDGYRAQDLEKFRKDARYFNDALFAVSPFKERKRDFNVWLVEVISQDAGIDKPDKSVWKSTALGTTYNMFGSARYILTEENRALRDAIAAAPYDFVNIIVNDDRYGGGGIYNLYTTCFANTDAPGQEWQREYVYVHEFGHSFGGLGDEYYTSQISYNEFYQPGVEPWEPNLTSLTQPRDIKWKSFVQDGTPLPTPWSKREYDSIAAMRGKLDRLAPDYYQKREPYFKAQEAILDTAAYAGKVGAFEGAGYVSEGIYRPSIDCRMFSLSLNPFDPVCSESIRRMIDFYAR